MTLSRQERHGPTDLQAPYLKRQAVYRMGKRQSSSKLAAIPSIRGLESLLDRENLIDPHLFEDLLDAPGPADLYPVDQGALS